MIDSSAAAKASGPDGAPGLVEHFFRHEYARLVAALTRTLGARHLELVEDSVQTALAAALTSWVAKELPEDPGAWLYRVAHNHALDQFRRQSGHARILAHVGLDPDPVAEHRSPRLTGEMPDDLLRMLFVCCDTAIPPESRLVLALKTLCGFSTAEIAFRLFISEVNVQKRLSRARDRLRELSPDLDTSPWETLPSRLPSVHTVLYLLFNEGYLSTQTDQAIRRELCDEAMRLTSLLAEHPIGAAPETFALLALMYFHSARLSTRLDSLGGLLVLEEQDRSRWDRDSIQRGAIWLARSAQGNAFSRYHAEAGIAAEHCLAPSFAQTRWSEIADLYAMLERIAPSPLHTMNRAIAVAEQQGPASGIVILKSLSPPTWLSEFYLWDAVMGELHRRIGDIETARHHLERACITAPTEAERTLLRRRLATFPQLHSICF